MAVKVVGLDKFVRHTETVSARVKAIDVETVSGIAQSAKNILIAEARADAPNGMNRFANGKGAKLTARYKITPAGRETFAYLRAIPPGAWGLLDKGAKEHQIGRRVGPGTAGRRGRRNQPGFLGNPARGFAAVGPVLHPKTTGKHTFQKGKAAAIARGDRLFRSNYRHAYVKAFAG